MSGAFFLRQFLGCSAWCVGLEPTVPPPHSRVRPCPGKEEPLQIWPCWNVLIWWRRAGDKVSLLVWMSVVVKLASWAVSMTTAFWAGGWGHAPVISMKRTMGECTLFKALIFQDVFEYNLEIGWIEGKVYFYAYEWGKVNWLGRGVRKIGGILQHGHSSDFPWMGQAILSTFHPAYQQKFLWSGRSPWSLCDWKQGGGIGKQFSNWLSVSIFLKDTWLCWPL